MKNKMLYGQPEVRKDFTGKVFYAWTVIGPSNRKNFLTCKCLCGKVKEVAKYSLISGMTKSCGCKTKPIIPQE